MKKTLSVFVCIGCCLFSSAQQKNKIVVETLLKTDTSYAGQKLVYPSADSTETTLAKVTIPPGVSTGWHKHDHPLFGYIQQGELTVEREGAPVFVMKPGMAYAEVTELWHNGTNKGTVDCILIVVYTGVKHHPVSVKREGF
ncbi:MAG: hypothetical protein RLY16_672 [Bacteroidota bacterium]